MIIAALGDSITAGAPGWDPDPAVREATGAQDPESQWGYWAERANQGVTIRNYGVNRERTDQIALRFEAACDGVDAIVIQGGVNNVVHARPIEGAYDDLVSMAQRARGRGLAVAIANVLPWNNGSAGAAEQIRDLNRRLAAFAAAERYTLLPFYETLDDPASPGRMADAWTAEGNHPSVEGHRRLGTIAFRVPSD